MDLAEVLQWVTLGRKTGSLTFIRNKIKNHIFLKDGQIISSRSNEPTKQIGHFLLFKGKITETQLKQGLEYQQHTRLALGKILVQKGFITQDEVELALIGRTQEVIYDLFLWDDGYFHFTGTGFNLDDLILINLDINAILFEGVRRKDEWARIRRVFPSNDAVLALRPDVDLKTIQLTPVQKKLLFLVNQGKRISEMILELHGSDFLVNFELFHLYLSEVVEVKLVAPPPPPTVDPMQLFNKGLDQMQNRQWAAAINVFQEVLRLDPRFTRADEQIDQAEKAICQDYYRTTLPAHKIPYFLVPESNLTRYDLTHEEGFIASRINGAWDLKSIIMLSPLREIEILQIVDKLMTLGLVGLK